MEIAVYGLGLAFGTQIVGMIVWFARLEGKVNTLEAVATSKDTDVKDRLARIEDKVDRLIETKFHA